MFDSERNHTTEAQPTEDLDTAQGGVLQLEIDLDGNALIIQSSL